MSHPHLIRLVSKSIWHRENGHLTSMLWLTEAPPPYCGAFSTLVMNDADVVFRLRITLLHLLILGGKGRTDQMFEEYTDA